ncbi:polynucleotide 5-hydroxyl-kinase grc3 [Phaffia rhodozyma]|uniref:Polynucleotide 5'-hydroxyl-kinase GRC3 n=1 Tax=Phaffia rhodozyma TaxID=264483 RepID=A0A0F7SU13_PHARH|nr:polynucleotide 5-hydroxyl-kinase grc3 [Phaffia rhodozyma]
MPSPSQKRRKLAQSTSSKSVEFDPIETVSFASPSISPSETISSSGDSSASQNGSKAQISSVKSTKKRKPTLGSSSASASTSTPEPITKTASSDKPLSAVAARKAAAAEVASAEASIFTIASLGSQSFKTSYKPPTASSKKRKLDKPKQAPIIDSSPYLSTSSTAEQVVQIPIAAPPSRPLSAIAARKAREAALLATSTTLPTTSPPTPSNNTPTHALEQPNDDEEDEELENHLAFEKSPPLSRSFRGFDLPGDIDRQEVYAESLDEQSESEEDEEITLKMDGEIVGLGFSHKSHRKGWSGLEKESNIERTTKDKEEEGKEEDMVAGDEGFRIEADGLMDDSLIMGMNSPVETEKEEIINKPFQRYKKPQPSAYKGAMSTFFPALGQNVILLSENRLRTVFDDVDNGENAVVVLLSENEDLIFSGTCILYPLHASLSLFGTTLFPDSNSFPVYAPTSHPLPVLTPSHASPSGSAESLIKKLGLDIDQLKGFKAAFLIREGKSGLDTMGRIVPNFESIWMGDMAGWGVRGFYPILHQSSFTAHSVPLTWHTALEQSIPRISSTQKSIQPLPCSDDGQSQDGDDDDDDGQTSQPFTALVKGPKRAGKSGFSRLLANRLLGTYRRVAFLETDLGQSEFGPEGSISLVVVEKPLLGPPFTHPAIPFRAHYLGSSSPRHNPTRYLTLIADLLESYRLSIQYPPFQGSSSIDRRNDSVIPIIVNTQGWVKGLGMDLLVRLERMVSPNVIYEFDPADEEEQGWEAAIPTEGGWGRFRPQQDFGEIEPDEDNDQRNRSGPDGYGHLTRSNQAKRYALNPIGVSPIAARYGAVDLRILGLISYFHSRFFKTIDPASLSGETSGRLASSTMVTKWDFSTPLVMQRPWTVDWTKAIERIYMVGSGAEEVASEEIWRALGGCVVALVRTDPSSSSSRSVVLQSTSTGFPYESGQPLPLPSATQYLGLAIIRSVPSPDAHLSSQASKTIHLLTPLPPDILPTARIIMRGDTELPVSAMLNWKDQTAMEGADGVAGLRDLPFLDHRMRPGADIIGGDRRKIRRNVQRRT